MIGKSLAHYRITDQLGAGGMGEVYVATDTKLGRRVALKLLPPDMAADPDRLERFQLEARAVAALNHPNIVTIYSVEEADGVHFLTLELIDGQTLGEIIPDDGLPLERLFTLAVPIADALSAAHEQGITHRDLKPANVMVSEAGRVKVLDFGLAKAAQPLDSSAEDIAAAPTLTRDGGIVGTVPYMSPEQLQGKEIDPRSDIFSLGILLFEMATGRRPFEGETSADLISSILRDTPSSVDDLRAGLPRHLGRITRRCLDKDPRRRYQTALDLRNELEELEKEVQSGISVLSDSALADAATLDPPKVERQPMVGRDSEAKQLRDALEQAAARRGSLVMVAGEPGVGKTRLTTEIFDEARRRGFAAFTGHCYEMEGAAPFIPWIEILESTMRIARRETLRQSLGDAAPEIARLVPELRKLYPDMPEPLELPPEEARRYLFKSFREFVERASLVQPVLLVLEDLHWADESTVLLLQHVVQHVAGMSVLVVGTYRDVELDVGRPLAKTLRELVRQRLVQRIALKRLPEEGVAGMLEAMSGKPAPASLVSVIYGETEGNPFFVEEVFQHLNEEGRLFDEHGQWRDDLTMEELDVPEGVRLVVGRRLERLAEDGQRVLTAAAVVGRRFSFELLEAIGSVDADRLLDVVEEAQGLHLIHPAPATGTREARYMFAHELIRQTLLDGLSLPRRQRLHLKVADALEATYSSDIDRHASALAHHLYQAGAAADEAKTIHFLSLAGDQAMGAGAFEDALESYTLVGSLLPADDGARRAETHRKIGLAQRSLGRWEEAIEEWRKALPLFENLGDRQQIAQLYLDSTWLLGWKGNIEECLKIATRGLEVLGDAPSAERCVLLGILGTSLSYAARSADAQEAIEACLVMADQIGEPRLRAQALNARAEYQFCFGQANEYRDNSEELVELLRASGDLWSLVHHLSQRQLMLVGLGLFEELEANVGEVEDLATRLGDHGSLLFSMRAKGMARWARDGDIGALSALAQQDLDNCIAAEMPWIAHAYVWLGLCAFWRGDWPLALELAGKAEGHEPEGAFHGIEAAFRLLLEAYAGNRESALAQIEQRLPTMPIAGQPASQSQITVPALVIEALSVLGERQAAAELYPALTPALETGTFAQFLGWGLNQTTAGIAAAAGRDFEQAEEHYRTALRLADELPFRSEQPRVRHWYAQMLLDRNESGDREKAMDFLQQAIDGYESIGMPRHVEMAKSLMD